MNTTKIQTLLNRWTDLIDFGEQISKKKANKSNGGLFGRIRRTVGKPVIFDSKTYTDQQKIQTLLCEKLPQYADLILSQPEIMDGYPWIRNDFIEIYFAHFRLVAEKLKKIINRTTIV